jgi:hypothetical protein
MTAESDKVSVLKRPILDSTKVIYVKQASGLQEPNTDILRDEVGESVYASVDLVLDHSFQLTT